MSGHLIAFVASFLAGATNAIAGGGTLITFPALVWLGLDPLSANITNTVSLWIGPLMGAFGFREHIKAGRRYLRPLLLPSLLGGFAGAYLLVNTPVQTFKFLVPFLILFATLLLAINDKVVVWAEKNLRGKYSSWVFLVQFLTAVYGGYFGAGMGIIVLASLSMIGIADIHIANGIKNLLGMLVNGIASGYFAFSKHVVWEYIPTLMLGFALGGYAGARLSLMFDRKKIKLFVILWGFILSLFFFVSYKISGNS